MKIAIITGATSGIGFEFLKQVRKEAYDEIWVIGRREQRLLKLQEKIPNLRAFPVDLKTDIGVIKHALFQEKPEVELLINAAGFGKIGYFAEHSLQDSMDMIAVNVRALTQMTKIVLPYMAEGGRIIQMSSATAYLPQPGFNVYSASKAYVYFFSKALHEELRPRKITVTAVCPGPTDTEFFKHAETYHKQLAYKKRFYQEPRVVAKKALQDSKKGKNESIPSTTMKILKYAVRMVPENLAIRLAGKMCKYE